ncbi:MAG TPA: hypothetical protein VGG19_12685 [Tepidisphaeraceae bacterium]
MRITTSILACLICVSASLAQIQLPFHENFSGDHLNAVWKCDLSKGNRLDVRDGSAVISAARNTFAHIRLPLNINEFRATVHLKTDSSETPAPELFVYWRGNHSFRQC